MSIDNGAPPGGMIRLAAPHIGEREKRAVLAVLDRGMLAQGDEVAALEREFAEYVSARHAVATSSGTAALHLALLAHGIGRDDEVITTSFTFPATVNSILYVGARPVFADVDASSFNIDPGSIASLVTARTRAIVPVHLFGQPCDMDAIQQIARVHHLVVIEDAAQAIGAAFNGTMVGSRGTAAFSLYATKNVTAGEGGIVTTENDEVAERMRLLRSHGTRQRHVHDYLGFNYRLSEIHAAIARVQLQRYPAMLRVRVSNASRYCERLQRVRVPRVRDGVVHSWHQFTVQVPPELDRARLMSALAGGLIESDSYYRTPVHRQPYIRDIVGEVSLPWTDALSESVLSLPVHPGVSNADVDRIADIVNHY